MRPGEGRMGTHGCSVPFNTEAGTAALSDHGWGECKQRKLYKYLHYISNLTKTTMSDFWTDYFICITWFLLLQLITLLPIKNSPMWKCSSHHNTAAETCAFSLFLTFAMWCMLAVSPLKQSNILAILCNRNPWSAYSYILYIVVATAKH